MSRQPVDPNPPNRFPPFFPIVVIVGRPNVGKSTLFNRLVGRRKAIVHEVSGTTRDFIRDTVSWNGKFFSLVDTGGIQFAKPGTLQVLIESHAQRTITQADLILWVVDAQAGPQPLDEALANTIRLSNKKTLMVANKADNSIQGSEISSFFKYGFKDILPVSALHGHGTGELLDQIVGELPSAEFQEIKKPLFTLALVGEPNCGKSTYLNQILHEERAIVSDEAGTTRDAIEEQFKWKGKLINLIDTAGLRARSKIKDSVVLFSLARTRDAIQKSDVALLFFDVTADFTKNSKSIARLISDSNKACILVANKWDLVQASKTLYESRFKKQNPFLAPFRLEFISALRGTDIYKPLEDAMNLWEACQKRISTRELNDFIGKVTSRKMPPPTVKLKFIVQTGVKPPTFNLFVKHPKKLDENYLLYLRNQIVKHFAFEGMPVHIHIKDAGQTQRRSGG